MSLALRADLKSYRYPAILIALFAIYFLAGKLALKLALIHPSASAVWPSTGIALAAALILGYRVWPAIFAGAFVVNITTAGSIATSLGIATGNTLEAIAGAWLVNRFAGGRNAFNRPPDAFRFVLLASLASTTISATIGVSSLALGGYAEWSAYSAVWLTWWLGDAVGALVIAPLLVLWSVNPRLGWSGRWATEASLLFASLLLVGFVVFGGILPYGHENYPLTFLVIPPLLWAAFRFGPREAATASFLLSAVATYGTLRESGPFARESANQTLLLLQAYMGTFAATAIGLAAVVQERRRADQERSYLADIVDSSSEAIIGLTLQGTITAWNLGAERVFGYRASEMHGQNVTRLILRQNRPDLPAIRDRILRGERVKSFRTAGLTKQGGRIDLSLAISPIKGASGKIEGISVAGQDISERKRSEERFQLAVESAPNAMVMVNQAGKIVLVNSQTEKLFGYGREELIGQPIEILVPAQFRNNHPVHRGAFLAEPRARPMGHGRDLYGRRKDGSEVPVEIGLNPIRTEEGVWVLGAIVDITERKRAEQEQQELLRRLAVERARLEAVLRHLPAGVIIAEAPSGRLILGNDQVEKIWRQPFVASAGIDQQAAYRGFYSDGRPYHPEDWPLARSIAHGEAVVDEGMEFLRGDGSRGAMLMSSSPIHDEQGRIVAGVAIFHDVTERKQAERDLQAALKEKEVLLREIHHRVKNNLQIMSSLLSLEQKHIEDPVARSKFRETQSRIKTMSLLHDALYRSQDLSQVDLAQYIGRITNTLFAAYDASRNGIALHIGIPEAFTNLDTAIPCGLIVNELVSNALKYAFPDGRKGEVSVGLEVNADGRFILRVSDNGAGSPADLDFRNTKSLGLQLVAALADQLEASIDLRRQGGTTFEIAFREQEYRRRY